MPEFRLDISTISESFFNNRWYAPLEPVINLPPDRAAGFRPLASYKRDKCVRVGDVVEITIPRSFVDCFYENNIAVEQERILTNHHGVMMRALDEMHIDHQGIHHPFYKRADIDYLANLAKAFARMSVKSKINDGNRRVLFTREELSNIIGMRGYVTNIRYCHTGNYNRAGGSSGGYDDSDYSIEPAFLSERQTHKILCVETKTILTLNPDYHKFHGWMENACVRKVMDTESNLDVMNHLSDRIPA